ncbi:hypothetical protein BKA80DRAFT_313529 [Phyllosticta citrichinensis]
MAPNLFVATQTLFTPRRWFSHRGRRPGKSIRESEHWTSPVPGIYEHIPGRGWYLVRPDEPDGSRGIRLEKPRPVKYSRVLRRYLFEAEYERRKLSGEIKDKHGKLREVGFFQLDDGVGWVNCWNHHGEFVAGPYERWCIDERTEKFRPMLKGDDPAWRNRKSTRDHDVEKHLLLQQEQQQARCKSSHESYGGSSQKSAISAASSSNSEDKSRIFESPLDGLSRPASTLDMVMSPMTSRPPSSSRRDVARSEGATRVNSRAPSISNGACTSCGARKDSQQDAIPAVGGAAAPPPRPAGCGNDSGGASTPRQQAANGNQRGLAAAVTKRLEEDEGQE